jgi:hypothetical protein
MITIKRWWNTLNNKISKECVQRERKRQRDTLFLKKKSEKKSPAKKNKKIKKMPC